MLSSVKHHFHLFWAHDRKHHSLIFIIILLDAGMKRYNIINSGLKNNKVKPLMFSVLHFVTGYVDTMLHQFFIVEKYFTVC